MTQKFYIDVVILASCGAGKRDDARFVHLQLQEHLDCAIQKQRQFPICCCFISIQFVIVISSIGRSRMRLAPGVYFIRIEAGEFSGDRRMVVLD
jgi:hypothetical protein